VNLAAAGADGPPDGLAVRRGLLQQAGRPGFPGRRGGGAALLARRVTSGTAPGRPGGKDAR
jgi:hypothetical protein